VERDAWLADIRRCALDTTCIVAALTTAREIVREKTQALLVSFVNPVTQPDVGTGQPPIVEASDTKDRNGIGDHPGTPSSCLNKTEEKTKENTEENISSRINASKTTTKTESASLNFGKQKAPANATKALKDKRRKSPALPASDVRCR
jgi:hypothetical protein